MWTWIWRCMNVLVSLYGYVCDYVFLCSLAQSLQLYFEKFGFFLD